MDNMTQKVHTEGINILLGDPKKAIIKLSIPMIIAMLADTGYFLVNAIWVSGKGADALSAVGFFFPFLVLLTAIASGIGVGGAAALSQQIGANNKKKASSIAEHTILLTCLIAIIIAIIGIIFIKPIYNMMGVVRSFNESVNYARIMFLGSILFFFSSSGYALLRGEGKAKLSMQISILGSILNVILDPIFIYKFNLFGFNIGFNLGIEGAAIATLIAISIACIVLVYSLFIYKKKSFINIDLMNFKFDKPVISKILNVGVPASFAQLSLAIMMGVLTLLVSKFGGQDGVAIFTAGWRIVLIAVLPLLGMALGIVPVFGAITGAKDARKLKEAFMFSIIFGIIMETVIAILIFFFASSITRAFTWSGNTSGLAPQISEFLKTICFFFPAATGGYLSASMFQGAGKGLNALIVTLLRTLFLVIPSSYIFAVLLDNKMLAINIGIIVGVWLAGIVSYAWAISFIKKQKNLTIGVEGNHIHNAG